MIYRITTPRTGIDHGQWSGESRAHALAAMLTAAGIRAEPFRRARQGSIFDTEPSAEFGIRLLEAGASAKLARLGLSIKGFRVSELEPIPVELFA